MSYQTNTSQSIFQSIITFWLETIGFEMSISKAFKEIDHKLSVIFEITSTEKRNMNQDKK